MNTKQAEQQSRWRFFLTIGTFVGLLILVFALRHQIADVIKNLGKINIFFLLLLIPLQVINYDAYARLYMRIFEILGTKVRYRALYRLSLELTFVNHILPSGGISGISYFSVRMRNEGVSATQATLAQIMKFMLLFISFQPLLVLALLLLALRGHANSFILILASSLITLLLVGTFIGIYIIESRQRIKSFLTFGTKFLNWSIGLVRRKHPETISIHRAQDAFIELHDNYMILKKNSSQLKMPFLYALIANITEIAAVYVVYIAFGELVNVGAVIMGYAVANFAGLISVLPAGIGIYEGLMTATLAATGIPASLSIPVTLMYRVLNMIIQIIPGYYFYQKSVRQGLVTKSIK
jgi:uncharacterized protein (TIRG00374 family)